MPLIQYDFAAIHVDAIKHGLRSIEDDYERHNERMAAIGARGRTRRSGRAPAGPMSATVADAGAREADRRAREEQRIQQQWDAKNRALKDQHLRAEERAAREQSRIQEREARQRTKATEREAREQSRIQQRWDDKNRALKEQHYRAVEREALRSTRERAVAEHALDVDTARRRLRARGIVGGILGNTVGAVSSVGNTALAMTGLAGGAIFATAIHGAMSREAKASDLANQLLGNEATPEKLAAKKREILGVTGAIHGISDEQAIAAMSSFQGVAGEGEATLKIAPRLAKTQLATGGNVEEIGQMYANVYASLRNASGGAAKSVDQLIAETDKMGLVFAAMGQKGAIELKDFAAIGGEVAAAATRYGGDQGENIRQVAAVAQIARQTGGARSAEEAGTAVNTFTADLIEHSKTIRKKFGIDVFQEGSGGTKLKSLDRLLPQLMAGTGGKLESLADVANIRGARSIYGLQDPYLDAYRKAKSEGKTETEAKKLGAAAASKRIAEFGGIAMTEGERNVKAESRLGDTDKQLEGNLRALNLAVGAELLPTVTRFIPEIAKLIPNLVKLAEVTGNVAKWFGDHSIYEGIGAIIGVALAKEIATAGIGLAASKALQLVINGAIAGRAPAALTGVAGTASSAVSIVGAEAQLARSAGTMASLNTTLQGGMGVAMNLTLVLGAFVAAFTTTWAALEGLEKEVDASRAKNATKGNLDAERFDAEYMAAKTPEEREAAVERAKKRVQERQGERGALDILGSQLDDWLGGPDTNAAYNAGMKHINDVKARVDNDRERRERQESKSMGPLWAPEFVPRDQLGPVGFPDRPSANATPPANAPIAATSPESKDLTLALRELTGTIKNGSLQQVGPLRTGSGDAPSWLGSG